LLGALGAFLRALAALLGGLQALLERGAAALQVLEGTKEGMGWYWKSGKSMVNMR
jgi:hypothetical protein